MLTLVERRWFRWRRVLAAPSLLSLDAPLVALAFAALGAAELGVRLGVARAFVLFSSVWLAYAADRFFDGLELRRPETASQRHRLATSRRSGWVAVWLTVLTTDLLVASRSLAGDELRRGVGLVAVVTLYFGLLRLPESWRRLVPKEMLVGGILSAGTCLFLIGPSLASEGHGGLVAIYALLLAALYWLDCQLVSLWELGEDQRQGLATLSAGIGSTRRLAICLAGYMFLLAVARPPLALAIPLALSATWLLALVLWTGGRSALGGPAPAGRAARQGTGREPWCRVLIDLGLAAPAVAWLVLHSLLVS